MLWAADQERDLLVGTTTNKFQYKKQVNGGREPANMDQTTPSASNKSLEAQTKRQQAREHLASTLRDKSSSRPFQWTRSLTEVNLLSGSKTDKHGVRQLGSRRHEKPLCRSFPSAAPPRFGERQCTMLAGTPSSPTRWHGAQPREVCYGLKSRDGSRGVSRDQVNTAGWSRHVTISEMNRILSGQNKRSQKETSDWDIGKYKVKISDLTSGTYPNIELTFFREPEPEKPKLLPKLNVGEEEIIPKETDQLKQDVQPTFTKSRNQLPHFRRSNTVVQDTMGAVKFLATLEKCRLSSCDKTRKWLMDNPVGAENTEVDRDVDVIGEHSEIEAAASKSESPVSPVESARGKKTGQEAPENCVSGRSKSTKCVHFGGDRNIFPIEE